MGFLDFFKGAPSSGLVKLQSGSFTVDRNGNVIVSTLPRTFPASLSREIGRAVLQAFQSAEAAQRPINELMIEYSALRLTARELRGGAIIFLAPTEASRNKAS